MAVSYLLSLTRLSVQGGKSLGGHFACLCREFDFYGVKKNIIIFQKENIFTLLIILIMKSLQIEIHSTNPQSAGINVQTPPRRLTLT